MKSGSNEERKEMGSSGSGLNGVGNGFECIAF